MSYLYLELSQEIEGISQALGYRTFDYLPTSQTPYPFVFIGELFTEDLMTATKVMGKANLIIHLFHYAEEMKSAKEMAFKLSQRIHEQLDNWQVTGQKGTFMFETDLPNDSTIAHIIIDITLENL